eukprot:6202881-Pleurochrysis_carterae.AAC.1
MASCGEGRGVGMGAPFAVTSVCARSAVTASPPFAPIASISQPATAAAASLNSRGAWQQSA